MSFTFRPAKRENVGLLIGLAGPSGSGKTYSAMRLASGISGGKPFAVIDTESGRALHYADQFRFDHAEMRPPFRPLAYKEAIKAADEAGYPVIVVDSMSHEHAGEGGILEYHDEELDRMAGNDWKKRERVKMAAWIKPKTEHKKMVSALLQVRAHIILCFRAEEKIEMSKENGKTVIVKKNTLTGLDGWCPISEKNLPYELTASFLMLPSNPGEPLAIKLQEQHKSLFPAGKVIDEEAGKRLTEWAKGGEEKPKKEGKPLKLRANDEALKGTEALKAFWESLTKAEQKELEIVKRDLKNIAAEIDRQDKEETKEEPEDSPDPSHSEEEAKDPKEYRQTALQAVKSVLDEYGVGKAKAKFWTHKLAGVDEYWKIESTDEIVELAEKLSEELYKEKEKKK